MSCYTLCCLALFSVCVAHVIARPHKPHHWKGMVKRWDLLAEYDPELRGQVPSNCDNLINQYTNGKILMFEYKIKMKRCMSKKDVLATDHKALTKSSLPGAGADAFTPSAAQPQGSNDIEPVSDFSESTSSNIGEPVTDSDFEHTQSTNTLGDVDGPGSQGIDASFDTHSMDTIDPLADHHVDTNEKAEDLKRTQLPALPGANMQPFQPAYQPAYTPEQSPPLVQQDPAANFYPAQDQTQYFGQPQAPTSEQAAVAPYNTNPVPETQTFQNTNQFAARSDIPNPAPAQDPTAQAQVVMDQWRSNSFGANQAKKDQTPDPNVQIAQFLNSQKPATNPAEDISQQGFSQQLQQRSDIQPQALPQLQQRSDIQPQALPQLQQRSDIQPQPQALPQPQQAAFTQYPAAPVDNLPL